MKSIKEMMNEESPSKKKERRDWLMKELAEHMDKLPDLVESTLVTGFNDTKFVEKNFKMELKAIFKAVEKIRSKAGRIER